MGRRAHPVVVFVAVVLALAVAVIVVNAVLLLFGVASPPEVNGG